MRFDASFLSGPGAELREALERGLIEEEYMDRGRAPQADGGLRVTLGQGGGEVVRLESTASIALRCRTAGEPLTGVRGPAG